MTKYRILHIPSGRFLTQTPAIDYGDFGLSRPEYGLGEYTKGVVYEAWFKWRAKTMLENIFAGAVTPSKELLLFNEDNFCEFEVVRVEKTTI